MIDAEYFDIESSYYEISLYETRIIQLWDRLPDLCKKKQLREKIKNMASSPLLSKLEVRV